MTITDDPWTSSAPECAGRQLVQLPLSVLHLLANGDLEAAQKISDQPLTPYLIGDECDFVWKRRRAQIEADPEDATWVTRLVVDSRTGEVVGRAGYHGPPDQNGMVEVGYAIDSLHRRKGHARAALRILIDAAREDPRVRVVQATVRPDNIASRGLVDQFGFREVGEVAHEEDGFMKVLELSVA